MRLPRPSLRHAPLAVLLLSIVVGCPHQREKLSREELEPLAHARLELFESEDVFDAYLGEVSELRERALGGGGVLVGCGGTEADEAPAPMEPGNDDESITNNQEEGVDEGGIVKAVDDYFVILRRGRLFTVRQGAGAQALMPVHQVDAYAPGFTQGSWYDEMLAYGRRIVVIGYSYSVGATEVVLFRLEDDGRLTHESSHFLRSNDYYSSRNYASRLVGGTLVFYIPHTLGQKGTLPTVGHWKRGNDTAGWHGVLSKLEVYKPVQPALNPMLHTVVRCDLDAPEFTCSARAVMGPSSRTFYVARDAVYVWVSGDSESWYLEAPRDPKTPPESYVYRLPLDGGVPTALRARGNPIDQFSFRENADGHLEVLLTGQGHGDAMWGPEITRGHGEFALLRAPLSSFTAEASPTAGGRYTAAGAHGRWAAEPLRGPSRAVGLGCGLARPGGHAAARLGRGRALARGGEASESGSWRGPPGGPGHHGGDGGGQRRHGPSLHRAGAGGHAGSARHVRAARRHAGRDSQPWLLLQAGWDGRRRAGAAGAPVGRALVQPALWLGRADLPAGGSGAGSAAAGRD